VSGDFDTTSDRERDRWINLELGYRRTLTELVDVSLRGYGDIYEYRWTNSSSAAEDCSGDTPQGCTQYLVGGGDTLGSEAQMRLSWVPELRLFTLIGVDAKTRFIDSDYDVVDHATGEEMVIQNDHTRTDSAVAVYAQQSASPLAWLDLNVGARFDYDERSGSALSPRSAVGVTPWAGARLKGIYSQAFRAPSAYELGYADYTTQISPEHLSAETVRSVEGSFEQKIGSHRIMIGLFRSWWVDMVGYKLLNEAEVAGAQAAGLLAPNVGEAYVYENIARIDNYGFNGAVEGSYLQHRLRFGLNVTEAFTRQDPRDGSDPKPLSVGPSLFGNARVSYEFLEPLPTLALAVQYQHRRLADRALDGGFASTPSAPAHVELKLTATGAVTSVPGLTYRAGFNHAFSRVSPYVIGPWQFAVDETTPYELAPLRRLTIFFGLEYQLGR
jgi:outer membrane receptor protein involved in Fe transport